MASVELSNLGKQHAGAAAPAVSEVNLCIAHGEFMVLLGPSGCGKTTTLRMIAGLESITTGMLSIDGRQMNDVPARDRDIAMVFQNYALYPHMNVTDNLAFGLRRRKVSAGEITRRVQTAAQALGLEPYLARKPNALSGGQRQRVALGRAIVREPKVFLFDEPLSNLDAALRVSTRDELAMLHGRLGATMIYVTHDQVEAMTLGSRICIMNAGRVEQVGAPLDVYRSPANTFVAGFLGSPPMNLLSATVHRADGVVWLAIGSQRIAAGAVLAGLPTTVGDGFPITVGVRPEDIALKPDATIHAQVLNTEALGAETLLLLQLPGVASPIRARLDRDIRPERGTQVQLQFDLSRTSLFDAVTGVALVR